MHISLPISAVLAWWTTSWLRGAASSDAVLDRLSDHLHLVDGHEGLVALLATLRAEGADGVGLALPTPGHLSGLGGPRLLNDAALDAGEAVICGARAWVPTVGTEVVTWQSFEALPRQIGDVGECDRELRRVLASTTTSLVDLDVARWRPEVADEILNLHHSPDLGAPPGTPERCQLLAARALQALAIVDLALEDDGGSVSSYEVTQRRSALEPLEQASRAALVAACSPEVWPR